jgi:saccharopine dehydrogenase-like NADP-dependent oxidoreductase
MRNILVAGAGKSSIYLIQYLLSHASRNKWNIIVADGNEEAIKEKIGNHPHAFAAVLDITDDAHRRKLVQSADLVVSLMPPQLHIHLAKDCLQYKKNLITSSYISDEMREMDVAVKAAGLMFMCEMGLDPGIDHMTASQIVHSVERLAGTLTSFKSYCGGLIAPESDDNPWHYKFSWNPKNIITAGADGASYLKNKKSVTVPYEKMFDNNKTITVNGLGEIAYYPNRDSLRYVDIYRVPEASSFLRATLRHPDFCKGWQALIELGLTDMKDMVDTSSMTYAGWVNQKNGFNAPDADVVKAMVSQKLSVLPGSVTMKMLTWLGLFSNQQIISRNLSSGEILLNILLEKWAMKPADKDMVVMQHKVEYLFRKQPINLTSTMVIKGEDRDFSAMAKTVGLPMGILARMVMNNKLKLPTGVLIPNMPTLYKPILKELEHHGITFREEVS